MRLDRKIGGIPYLHGLMAIVGSVAVARLKSQLLQADIRPSQVVVEISESVLVRAEEVRPQIQALRTMGVRIAIDDFGTGSCPWTRCSRPWKNRAHPSLI